MENNVTAVEKAKEDDGLLDVGDLVRMFEESEESTVDSRALSERDRDYVDNKQLTAAEEAALKKRGQPPVVINRIKGKVEFLCGMEMERRIDPKAHPRTPKHAQDADGASQALKYSTDSERYDHKRSRAWRNIIVEGAAGFDVAVEPGYNGEMQVVLRRLSWDRMFWDPHSSETDFSDAGYVGTVVWMDYADALKKYPDGKEALDNTMDERGNLSDTYDDKPKWRLWADKKRKRVRICQIWIKRGDDWFFAEFTKGGILKSGPSPYKTDKKKADGSYESDCGLAFVSGYVDRENNRYGIVREMISPQDEVNKRRSKALHLLNTVQIYYEDGSVDDIEAARKEAAKADGAVKVSPGALRDGSFKVDRNIEVATAQFQLLQESKNEIDLRGPNATMMGEKAQGSSAASGRAIIASQQGGMMEIGELLDNLRDLDLRVFRKVWYRIRQFWTAEKWIRTTDDERNVKWVVMNMPPEQLQQIAMSNPEMAQSIKGYVQNVAELDCDIIIDDAPDAVTPALEQWEAIVELEKAKPGTFPTDVLIEAAPNLKNKEKLLERLSQPNPQAQMQQRGAEAEIAETESRATLNMAKAHKEGMPEAGAPLDMGEPFEAERQAAEIEGIHAKTENTRAQTHKTMVEAEIAPVKVSHDAQMQRAGLFQQDRHAQMNFQQKSQSDKLKARQQQRKPAA